MEEKNNLPTTYNPKEFEERIYKIWEEKKYFTPVVDKSKKPFSIVMPPPNITGRLHLGHALDNTLQDMLIRFKRMQGYCTLWLPGQDHASIATEVKVENELLKQGLVKKEMGREAFLEKVWEWSDEYRGHIREQLKKMGVSADFSREAFTMDENLNKAVRTVFVKLYNEGLIYQGNRITNWCPKCTTALSDAEKAKALQIAPGDVKWKDINNDGTIDAFDQVVMGNTTPHWFGGFNTTLTWKGLTLYGRFDFALDYWIYDNTTPWFLGCMQGGYNTTTDVFNTWSEENPNAKYPRYVWADQLGTANYYRTSTMFAYKGNYLAIREISLSYSLPQNIARKFYCQKLDVSVTGQNLGYITSANVASPEVSTAGSGYALPRTLLFGVNVTF